MVKLIELKYSELVRKLKNKALDSIDPVKGHMKYGFEIKTVQLFRFLIIKAKQSRKEQFEQ